MVEWAKALGLHNGGEVGHVGGGVGEVDAVGQVPVLLLLLGPPGCRVRQGWRV